MTATVAAVPVVIIGAIASILGGTSNDPAGGTGTGLRTDQGIPPADAALYEAAANACPLITAPILAAQGYAESGFNPTAVSHSTTGAPLAYGIAQFTPQTWAAYSGGQPLANAFIPADAIPVQSSYDCALAKDVAGIPGDPLALTLAAYNAGPYAVIDVHGIPDDAGVKAYIAKIETLAAQYAAPNAAVPPANQPFVNTEMAAAKGQLGLPYIWGGGNYNGPTAGGFDCSGLVMYAIYQASHGTIELDHDSNAQARGLNAIGGQVVGTVIAQGMGSTIPLTDIQVGDAIGFQIDHGPDAFDHIGIYAGNGILIHASHPGTDGGVKYEPLTEGYFQDIYWSVVRFAPAAAPASPGPDTAPATTPAKP